MLQGYVGVFLEFDVSSDVLLSFCWKEGRTTGGCLGFTLQGTNISPKNGILKMIFLFPRWDMLISWRVYIGNEILPSYMGIKQ